VGITFGSRGEMPFKRDDGNDDDNNNFVINTEYEVSLYVIHLRSLLCERFEVIAAILNKDLSLLGCYVM
jgi:hypothetical protein